MQCLGLNDQHPILHASSCLCNHSVLLRILISIIPSSKNYLNRLKDQIHYNKPGIEHFTPAAIANKLSISSKLSNFAVVFNIVQDTFRNCSKNFPNNCQKSVEYFPPLNQLLGTNKNTPTGCLIRGRSFMTSAEVEKVVDSANLVRRKYSEKPGLAENI